MTLLAAPCEVPDNTGPYERPFSAYLQPISDGTEVDDEVFRAYFATGLSLEDLQIILVELEQAKSDVERVEIVNLHHLLSPASPDPDRYHRPACDCGRHGQIALHATVEIAVSL